MNVAFVTNTCRAEWNILLQSGWFRLLLDLDGRQFDCQTSYSYLISVVQTVVVASNRMILDSVFFHWEARAGGPGYSYGLGHWDRWMVVTGSKVDEHVLVKNEVVSRNPHILGCVRHLSRP